MINVNYICLNNLNVHEILFIGSEFWIYYLDGGIYLQLTFLDEQILKMFSQTLK